MSIPEVPKDLPALVKDRFQTAKDANALSFWPTEVAVLRLHGAPFQLRFCPALANKPKSEKPKGEKKAFDPFQNPLAALLVTELPPSHFLVLNKFAIVPEHFILATKAFKQQTHLLEADDLAAAYACLKAWKATGKELFAFFNSGPHSGASQPHRHVQFLPVDSMLQGVEEKSWKPLADQLASKDRPELPFACLAAEPPEQPSSEQLHGLYKTLHGQACTAVRNYVKAHPSEASILEEGGLASPISYNLALTDKSMVICPRRAEGKVVVPGGKQENSFGPVALNGTVLAGTLLVKDEKEWNGLRNDHGLLLEVLEAIGIPLKSEALERI